MSHRWDWTPARDAQPLSGDELAGWERDLLFAINSALRGIRHDAVRRRGRASQENDGDPWGHIDHQRSGRILMIDGSRGLGKTSLLLTLLDGWSYGEGRTSCAGWDDDALRACGFLNEPAGASGPGRDDMRGVVRFLPILEFDPLPPNMPLHAWLLEPWQRIAEVCDRGTSSSLAPHPTGGSHPQMSLVREWQALSRQAVIGWGAGASGGSDNLVELAVDVKSQIQDWVALPQRWRRFVDRAIARLESDPSFPRDGIVVVPIDDVDLQIERTGELLHALRLLQHPRVCYLLTGDLPLMTDMLARQLRGRLERLAPSVEGAAIRDWPHHLAMATIAKVIPPHHRFLVRRICWNDLGDVRAGPSQTIASALESLHYRSPRSAPTNVWRSVGERSASIWNPELNTFRGLTQGLQQAARRAADFERIAPEIVRGLSALAAILHVEDVDFSAATAAETDGRQVRLRLRYEGTLVAAFRSQGYVEVEPLGHDVVFGTELAFVLHDAAGDGYGPDDNADRYALALALAHDSGRSLVDCPGLLWDIGPALVWTRNEIPSLAIYPWPWMELPAPFQLLEWARDWRACLADIHVWRREDRVGVLAICWLFGVLRWSGYMSPVPIVSMGDASLVEIWHALVHYTVSRRRAHGGHDLVGRFGDGPLMLMAAPEVGLPPAYQSALVDAIVERSRDDLGRWTADEARRLRHEQVVNALYWAAGDGGAQNPRRRVDWAQVHERADEMIQHYDRYAPRAEGGVVPWHVLLDSLVRGA